MSQRHLKELQRTIRPFGLAVVRGTSHLRIVDRSGRFLTPVSNSPTCAHAAKEETIRRLIRLGALPADALRRG
jgi:hypothetical protein